MLQLLSLVSIVLGWLFLSKDYILINHLFLLDHQQEMTVSIIVILVTDYALHYHRDQCQPKFFVVQLIQAIVDCKRRSKFLRSLSIFFLHYSNSRMTSTTDSKDLNKINSTSTNVSLIKKSSNGQNLDDSSSTGQSQIKLMPIMESGENEDKSIEQPATNRINTNISSTIINWTPTE